MSSSYAQAQFQDNRVAALQTDEKRLLELMALNAPLQEILDALLRMIESRSPAGLLASILLVDSDAAHLRFGAAPSLPESYNQAIDGIPIAYGVGSCGTAAFLKQSVQVSDIAHDPLWHDFRELAISHCLAACWSTPILSSTGQVLGTFGMYYRTARTPHANDLELVDITTRTAAIIIEREYIQETLRASEERYQLINRATNDIIWDWSFKDDVVAWNAAVHEQLGYTLEEIGNSGSGWYEKIHPEDHDRVVAGIHAAIDGDSEAWRDEYRFRKKDGSYAIFLDRGFIARDTAGRAYRMIGSMLNVTERKHTEEALKVSEANSRDILQSISDGFIALDENWRFTYINHSAEQMLGRTVDDLAGKSLWEEYPELLGTVFERNYRHVLRTCEALTFSDYFAEYGRWYEIRVYPSAKGICVYFRNVTEQVAAQDALRTRHERSRLIAAISAWLVLRTANAKADSVDHLLESVFLNVAQHLNAEYYFNFAATEGAQTLRLISCSGLNAQQRSAFEQINIGEYLCGIVARSHQPLILEDLQKCDLENASALVTMGVQAYAGFPLLADGHLLGTISFATASRTSFGEEELELIQTVVDLLAAAIQREHAMSALQASEQRYRSLFRSIDEGFCTIEVVYDHAQKPCDYRYLKTNPAFEKQTGMSNAAGRTIRELAPGIETCWIEVIGKVAQTGQPLRYENYAAPLQRWFSCYIFVIDEKQPDIVGIIFSDITDRKRHELNLALLSSIQQAFASTLDTAAILQVVGQKICQHFGFASLGFADIDETPAIATTVFSCQPAGVESVSLKSTHQLREFLNDSHLALLKSGNVVAIDDVTNAAIKNSGAAYAKYQTGSAISAPVISEGAWKFLVSGTHRESYGWRDDEIELLKELASHIYLNLERARVEARVRESEARYRALIDASSQVIYRLNADLTELFVLKDGGFIPSDADVRTNWLHKYVHPEDQLMVLKGLHTARQNKTLLELEHRVKRIDGSWGWIFSRATPLLDAKGHITEWFGAATDITDRKQFEDTLWQGANFDNLTGLPNRRLFRDRLEQEIKKAHRSGLSVALFFIDLDRFKQVNDLHGHATGDALLVEASRRIHACVREFDTVARLGGDEFTAILSGLENKSQSELVAQKILNTLSQSFQLANETVHLSSSIGITYFPDDAGNADDLIRNADLAMYSAKYAGRNQVKPFVPRMQHEAMDRLRLIEDLRNASANGQFEVYYQPVVHLKSGKIVKAEALLRWHHPLQGRIDPSVFIPFAEDSGLINGIGDWVFTEAAACCKICETHTGAPFQISVNKSPLQFHANVKALDWIAYLEAQQLPPSSISIEITEGLLLNTSQETRNKLLSLRNAGMEVAIDDFGTGYSSMAYLEFEIDYLKIDQSFITNMANNKAHFAIIRSIIAMAHELEIKVIAEGIETPSQQQLLIEADCDFGQGYLFSEALPSRELLRMLN
jgi:diguanylate cyclase (GGDEF)-like protein/PAS domain S-box-containing protein